MRCTCLKYLGRREAECVHSRDACLCSWTDTRGSCSITCATCENLNDKQGSLHDACGGTLTLGEHGAHNHVMLHAVPSSSSHYAVNCAQAKEWAPAHQTERTSNAVRDLHLHLLLLHDKVNDVK
jgi:hypothetical protein